MKFLTVLICLLTLLSAAHTQEVTLSVQIFYDGEKLLPAGKATVYFSDGQLTTANKKGIASRKFIFTDSTLLVKIDKIVTGNGESKLVNRRQLQYILLDRTRKKTNINAYILEEAAWTERQRKFQQVVDEQYENLKAEFSSLPNADNNPMLQEMMHGFTSYKPILVSNISSTVYSELTDSGKTAFNLVLESSKNIPQAITLLENNIEEKKDAVQDILLVARLGVLSLDKMAGYYYLYPYANSPSLLGTLMEYKEMVIMLSSSAQLEPELKKVLGYVKDPEFQATNRNDLASIYQDRGDYKSAITEALQALEYYKTLEKLEPTRFRLNTTAVMFNLGNAYMKLEQYDEALNMFQAVIERISSGMLERTPEIKSMEFYATKFIANITKQVKGLKDAYHYYDKIFIDLKKSPEISSTLPKDILFGDYLDYCEGKELIGATADEVADCYEESVKFLDNAFDSERKTLGRTLVYYKLAKILEEKGEYEQALDFYQRSLSELEQNETPKTRDLRMELYNCVGEVLDDYGRDQDALSYFHRSIQLAQASGYENDANSIRQLSESWYKMGQFYYKRQNGDSAYYAFKKTVNYLNDPHADRQKNAPLLANTYNMIGATLSELINDKQGGEENFRKSVNLYQELMSKDPDTHIMDFAKAANNLLAMQSQHPETSDKDSALALIDDVMQAFIMHPVHSSEAEELKSNMNRYMLLFSGHLTLIQNAMMEVRTLNDQRQQIKGNAGKSEIQSRIVSKLQEAYLLVDTIAKFKIKSILAQELGNLSWYAIFDRKFALAESSARHALALDSTLIWVNTNLAHSLILMGKVEEGKALYDQYKDIKHTDGRLMRAIFLSDIDEMEKAGITNPEWEEVRRLLR